MLYFLAWASLLLVDSRLACSSISTWISPANQITEINNDENTNALDTERAFDISIIFSSLSPVTMLDKNSVKHKCCALQRWVLTNYRLTHGFYRSHLAECQIFINNTTTATWIFEIPWNDVVVLDWLINGGMGGGWFTTGGLTSGIKKRFETSWGKQPVSSRDVFHLLFIV